MEKYYYPDKKMKKQCMKVLMKKSPEYKRRKWAALFFLIGGVALGTVSTMALFRNWENGIWNEDFVYGVIMATGYVCMPGFAFCIWQKRYYKCCGELYMRDDKTLKLTEEFIEFSYHYFHKFAEKVGSEEQEFPNSLNIARYRYDIIRAMKFEPDTQILTLKGAVELEKYWDFTRGIKDTIDIPTIHTHDETTREISLCYPEYKEILDILYERVKDTVWEDIEKTW